MRGDFIKINESAFSSGASQSLFGIGDDRARTEERMLSTDVAARY